MSILSVPLTPKIEKLLNSLVNKDAGETRAQVARTAILKYLEDRFVEDILTSSREAHEGKYFEIDLGALSKKHTK